MESPIAKAISSHIEPQEPEEEEGDLLSSTDQLLEQITQLLAKLIPKEEAKPNIEVLPWRMMQ